ncbi:TonB-dependent copper receptor [Ferrimonas lipolytica]|uniref:TonB-dependent copper receptor n=2 Tax=Ferrimonas lipolytica TaxID=2724191 RepID=A0A6H1UJL5_9GAMM|nr:TonB-dependent copper receptor [Ferrimonas lipolytica]
MNVKLMTMAAAVQCAMWAPQALATEGCGDRSCDETMVVVADTMDRALTTVADPKLPRQPIPTFDGSGFLKTIPGFNVTRKGGAGGDISLRGMAGSRISVINDGQQMGGTCGGRMDPPTNYIAPETYEQVTVIKGPQTVKYGPVGSAGTVLFERDHFGMDEQGVEGRASMTVGSNDRLDYVTELKVGDQQHYWSLDLNGSESDNFEDGDGNEIQSRYDRDNLNAAIGWTPTEASVVELNYGESSGEAEYADRANKARVIDNENWSLLAKTDIDHQFLRGLEFLGYWNENDHIMDTFDTGGDDASGVNPRRTTYGAHLWVELELNLNWQATIGVDFINSTQDMRSGSSLNELAAAAYKDVFSQENIGIFIESENGIGNGSLFTGLRYDQWQTELHGTWAGGDKDTDNNDDLFSGFVRYQYDIGVHQYYVGLGHSERIADYWETMKFGKKLELDTEKTNQLDIGWIYSGPIELTASLFYADLQDYILIDTNSAPNARNVDATLYGGEASAKYNFSDHWSAVTTVAYSHGDNDSDDVALGQVSPLEGRLAVNYQAEAWSFGALWRLVDKQDRVAEGQGNIVGQDLGETAGFGVLSLNGAWDHSDAVSVSFGIDNLLDKTYAEHIAKSGAGNDALPINERTEQVNEPGRTGWIKLSYQF